MSRKTPFQPSHALEYGLSITERDLQNAVSCVQCDFCLYYGRTGDDVGRKRARRKGIKFYRPPFRPEQYRRHLLSQHAVHWDAYQSLSNAEKKTFFDTQKNAAIKKHCIVDRATYRHGSTVRTHGGSSLVPADPAAALEGDDNRISLVDAPHSQQPRFASYFELHALPATAATQPPPDATGAAPPTAAYTAMPLGSTLTTRLSALEARVFGQPCDDLDLRTRLIHLEQWTWGMERMGAAVQRIEQLEQLAG